MAKMLLIDSLKELRTVIDQQHLLYLELDESPKKIDQRDKLECYIKEYLCLAPHDSKFTFHQTAEVLHRSAYTKNNFSAYKAAVAWKAIGKYADNLISHPWRKEYRDIKLYCGFYKHEIEENLVGAELMFEAMGYRHVGQSSMTLPGILDPDRITSVSKDAIIAFVECQIMKQIWEALSSHINISWYEVLEFRENHTGTPDQVIRALTYKYRLRLYQEQLYHRPQQIQTNNCHLPQSHCMYGTSCYNQNPYPGPSYSLPVQGRYGYVSPQNMIQTSPIYPTTYHPSYAPPHSVIKPQDMYPVNGYHMRHHYPPQMGLTHIPHNGCSMVPMMYPGSSIVPTGQLIELDSSPTHNGVDPYSQRFSKYSPQEDQLDQCALKDDIPSLSGRAKDDGAGAWENWDYVYRNLESHGYKKDFEPCCEVTLKENLGSSSQNNSSEVEVDGALQSDFSEKFQRLKLESNNQAKVETSSSKTSSNVEEESNVKNIKEKSRSEVEKPKEHVKVKVEVKSSKTSPEKKKSGATASCKITMNKKKENEASSKESSKSRKLKEDLKPLIVNIDDQEEKWQCITCTYLNSASNNVCEMCFKSKDRGSELNPQPSGGQECPKCTLVNEPGLTNCAACTTSLKDSPTYI